jgi:hypothetical protein
MGLNDWLTQNPSVSFFHESTGSCRVVFKPGMIAICWGFRVFAVLLGVLGLGKASSRGTDDLIVPFAVLQESAGIAENASWSDSSLVVTPQGGVSVVQVNSSAGPRFFRLRSS